MRRTAIALLVLPLLAPQAYAQFSLRRPSFIRHISNISQHKRLNVNDLIAEPGTVELDWGGLYSYTTGAVTLPSAIRFTPLGKSILLGRTEYSVAFDSIASAVNTGTRSTQFSDRLTFAATAVVLDSDHFDIAIAPQITTLLRNDSGLRVGATTIARYDGGPYTIAGTVGWSGATSSTLTNPAGTWDFGWSVARHLAENGTLSKITPHVHVQLERSTGFERTLAAFVGVEYQMTKRLAADVSVQRFGIIGGGADRQVLVGFTYNLGKLQD